MQQLLETAVADGLIGREDLMSDDYQPIPNTNPPKFSSRFDAFCDRALPLVQEQVLKDNPNLIFAICTDKRGYVPTHNDKFSKPPTGDYTVDLVHSRSKRIFNDRTGSRCGAHTKKCSCRPTNATLEKSCMTSPCRSTWAARIGGASGWVTRRTKLRRSNGKAAAEQVIHPA